MTAPDIHTGSAILQARGALIADMARVQNQASENVVKSIQGISDNLHRWQDRLDKQAQLKVENDYRNATLDEARRMNDANIQKIKDDEAYRQAKLPDELKKMRADANLANSQAQQYWNWHKDWKANKNNLNNPPQDPNATKGTKQGEDANPIKEAKAEKFKTGIPFVDNLVAVGRLLNGISNTGQKKAGL